MTVNGNHPRPVTAVIEKFVLAEEQIGLKGRGYTN
jgi:hypothetical protein